MSTRINQHTAEQMDLADFYERHAAQIRAFIAGLTSDSDTAEDLCHDTFLKALRGWSSRRQTGSTVAWLYQIARNTAYDYLRCSQGIIITDICGVDIEVRDDQIARIYPDLPEQLAKLSSQTRHALLLFGAGYRTQEIATMA